MRLLIMIAVFAGTACVGTAPDGEPTGSNSQSSEPEIWSLSPQPLLNIGVVEGDEPFQLHSATSSLHLPDGRLVVVNGGSSEVRFFDGGGEYLGAFGREGDGPGEFRTPSRISLTDDGHLRVWDARLDRFSFHDMEGTHLRVQKIKRDSGEPFPGDVWLYRRNLIDSPIAVASRQALIPGLDALPPIDSLIPVRFVRLTEQGRFWVHDQPLPNASQVEVSVYSFEGERIATVTIPPQFEPHDIGPDYVLGRGFDDLEVNYIQHYALDKPSGSSSGPGLIAVRASEHPPVIYSSIKVPDEAWPEMKSTLKYMASRQEINYSTEMSYSTDLVALEMHPPEGMRIDFLEASSRGWTGVITHTPSGAYCILTYGLNVPMGWTSGSLTCPGR